MGIIYIGLKIIIEIVIGIMILGAVIGSFEKEKEEERNTLIITGVFLTIVEMLLIFGK